MILKYENPQAKLFSFREEERTDVEDDVKVELASAHESLQSAFNLPQVLCAFLLSFQVSTPCKPYIRFGKSEVTRQM